MAFKFRLDAVERHRKTLMNFAQREMFEAQKHVNDQMDYISSLYDAIDSTREKMHSMRQNGSIEPSQFVGMDQFIELQNIKIERAREKARNLLSILEEKQDVLAERAKDLKILEKLREKHHQSYVSEQLKKESAELDDISVMRRLGGRS